MNIFLALTRLLKKSVEVISEQGILILFRKLKYWFLWYLSLLLSKYYEIGWKRGWISNQKLLRQFIQHGRSFSDSEVIRFLISSVSLQSSGDLFIFPGIDWDFLFQRPQQLATIYAQQGFRVYYLRVDFKPLKRPWIRMVSSGVFEVQIPGPMDFVYFRNPILPELIQSIIESVLAIATNCQLQSPTMFVEHPFWTPAVIILKNEQKWPLIYDCLDDHSGFQDTLSDIILAEENLLVQSDLVLATSRKLLERCKEKNNHCQLVCNGADFDHFFLPTPVSKEIQLLPHPVIGYVGALAEWFDFDLLVWLAEQRPNWTFVLIGDVLGVDLNRLKGIKNLVLLGKKSYSSLPAYIQGFDVCTIPFRRIPLTEATNPVKLFEYLSTGKPVVSTCLNELTWYSEYVFLPTTRDEWLLAIEQAIRLDDDSQRQKRIAFAKENSWKSRVDTIQKALQESYFTH